ncbi:MAG TPA: EAL domain-containing protein [Hyphomicrobiales bacterium]|nr:EAL domain-containing protein [Hyphomicrobiales bacterium]
MSAVGPGAPAAALGSPRAEPLADGMAEAILASLPIGITVRGSDGRRLFSNASADAIAPGAAPEDVEVATARIAVDGDAVVVETRRDVSGQRRLERELFDRAYLDELTGLANRSLIRQSTEELIAAAAPGHKFAMAFIDIDNFKQINDYYSHGVGDLLLVKIANRLCETVRASDMVARIGGDEFVVLLNPAPDDEALRVLVERVAARLKEPLFVDGQEIMASASIGVSVFPRHGDTYEMLRQSADSAMYRVKSGIKGGVAFFDATMEKAATARMAIEQRLRLAIRDRRFACAYQPKVDIRKGGVTGVEVLLRWRDADGVIQAPGEFVGVAVELGVMDDITRLVVAETIANLDRIDAVFGPDVSISINVAAKQADDPAFMQTLAETLAASGAAHRFVVEVTEEAFFAKSRFQREVLPGLRAIGAKVSIDDFGVGYSSLSALADITADELKIDRSFITQIERRPRSQLILRAIESLATALGMSIVAEGVETDEELGYLREQTNIRYVQGYYFFRPMFLGQIEAAPWAGAPVRAAESAREDPANRLVALRSVAPARR